MGDVKSASIERAAETWPEIGQGASLLLEVVLFCYLGQA